jgi:hypothetical protein
MTEQQAFERFVADNVSELTGGMPLPDSYYEDMHLQASHTGQLPRWLAVIKEPPMRISSSVAVGSPTVRVAAIMVATLLIALMIAGAGIAGSRLLAADGTIVVDQSGNGTTTTITAAVEMAEDGDTILVKPGTYDESVTITKDITIRGDGDRADIMVELSTELTPGVADGTPDLPFAIRFEDAAAALENLTLRGEAARIVIAGGSPRLIRLHLDGTGRVFGVDTSSYSVPTGVDVEDGADAVIEDSVLDDVAIDIETGSSVAVSGNELNGGYIWMQGSGVTAELVDNTFTDTPQWAVSVEGGATAKLTGNEFHGGTAVGVNIQDRGFGIPDTGTVAEVRDNRFFGGTSGIVASSDTTVEISGNRFEDVGGSAIGVTGPASATVTGNTVEGGGAGIVIDGDFAVDSNTVTGVEGRGLTISGGSPVLTGNRVCDNGTNLFVSDLATPLIDDSNEICPEDAAD